MKKYYVYLLECVGEDAKITYYCGYTSKSPSERLKEHIRNVRNKKRSHYTGRQKFVKLVYHEIHEDRKTAMKREREIKRKGSKYKMALVGGGKKGF